MNVVGFPGRREPEPYLSRAELAQRLRVSVKTVDRWKRAGMPHETWGLRTPRFLQSRCEAWLRARPRSERVAA